jgi:hypothetical protein
LRSSGHKLKIGILPKNSKLDGNLSKYSNWQLMKKNCDASPAPKGFETQVSIMLSADGKELRIGAICNDANIKHIKAHCVKADDFSIFRDDVLEVYVNTPTHRYSKIVVNTNGKIYDETRDSETVAKATLPILWSPGCRAVIKKEATRWLAEIAIPTNDFGNKQPWGIQVGRTCFTARPPVTLSIAPTGGIYAKQDKWARGTFDNSNIQ